MTTDGNNLCETAPDPAGEKPESSGKRRQRLNALKTGLWVRVPLGELPKVFEGIRKRVDDFRWDLEQAVRKVHSEIDIVRAHLIATACRHARQLGCCERMIRTSWATTAETWLAFSDRITRHSEGIDRILKLLGIERKVGPKDVKAMILEAGREAAASSGPEAAEEKAADS